MTKERFRVLDIGAGNSGFLMSLLLMNMSFFMHMLKKHKCRSQLIAGDARFQSSKISWHFLRLASLPLSQVLASVKTIPAYYEHFLNIKNSSLDIVTLNSFYPLLGGPDRERLKDELYRTVKPGGLFIEAHASENFLPDENFLAPHFDMVEKREFNGITHIQTKYGQIKYPPSRTIQDRLATMKYPDIATPHYIYSSWELPPALMVWRKKR